MGYETLGGYGKLHERPPAFEGADGRPYSADVWVDEEANADGSFSASLIFVRWAVDGSGADGHLESDRVARAGSRKQARRAVLDMPLVQVKQHLDRLIEARSEFPVW